MYDSKCSAQSIDYSAVVKDIFDIVLGDDALPIHLGLDAYNQIIKVKEDYYYEKLSRFFQGTIIESEDKVKLSNKLLGKEQSKENVLKLLKCVDDADSMQKIDWIINATKSLMLNEIDLPIFFRICGVINNTVKEDLLYLKKYIKIKQHPYNIYVQGLVSAGLMYMSTIDKQPEYSFVTFAKYVYVYALDFSNIDNNRDMINSMDINTLSIEVFPRGLTWGDLAEGLGD